MADDSMSEFERFGHELLDSFLDACQAKGMSAIEAEQLATAMAQSIQETNQQWLAIGKGSELHKPLGTVGKRPS